jgi:hypothetical protein
VIPLGDWIGQQRLVIGLEVSHAECIYSNFRYFPAFLPPEDCRQRADARGRTPIDADVATAVNVFVVHVPPTASVYVPLASAIDDACALVRRSRGGIGLGGSELGMLLDGLQGVLGLEA